MTDIIAFGDAAAEVAQISADAAASASSAFAHSRHLSAKAARLRADKWSLDSSFALWVLADDWHSVEEMAAALQRVDLSHDKATTAAREAIASGIARVQVCIPSKCNGRTVHRTIKGSYDAKAGGRYLAFLITTTHGSAASSPFTLVGRSANEPGACLHPTAYFGVFGLNLCS